jgi:hemoglobin/transferrin/lactoferrin receptor protein
VLRQWPNRDLKDLSHFLRNARPVILLAPCLTTAAHAAGPASDSPILDTVTVVDKIERPLAAVAASVAVLDDARLQATLTRDIRDLTRYEPGLSVRYDASRFGIDTIAIRGIGGNRVLAAIDGVPIADSFAIGSFADSGHSFPDTELIRRVEVLRGPASTLYGSKAIGGVVRLTTYDPADLVGAPAGSAGRLRTGFSSDDRGWFATGIAATARDFGEGLIAFTHREGQERDNNGASLSPNPQDRRDDSVLARWLWPQASLAPLRLSVAFDHSRADTEVNSLLRQPGRFINTTALGGEDESTEWRLSVDQEWKQNAQHPFGGLWRLYVRNVDTDQLTHEQRQAAPPSAPPLAIERDFRYGGPVFGGEFTGTRDATAGRFEHRFVFGVDAASTGMREMRSGQQTNLNTGVSTTVILGEALPVRDFPKTRVIEAGLYAQDEITRHDSAWSVIPGMRVDYYHLRPQPDAIYVADNPATQPVTITETSLAPKLGALWRISARATAFAQYTYGFRSPPFDDVNIGLDIPLFNFRAIPNPGLRPEKSNGYEIGMRFNSAAVSGTVSLFLNDYHDFIASKVNLGPDPVTGVILFQSRNLARAQIRGAEYSISLIGGEFTPRLDGWSLRTTLAYARGEDRVSGAPINSVDPLSMIAAVRYESHRLPATVELATTYVAAQDRSTSLTGTPLRLPGYVTFDVLGSWRIRDDLRMNFAVFNLTDRRYIEWRDVNNRTAGDPQLPLYQQPGINASMSLTWKW